MTTYPSISVIIPAFNCGAFIEEAIESVLAQTLPNEIVVVDDGSTDDSASKAKAFGGAVRVESQHHVGISAARNRGVESSTGSVLAFLDADDIWLPSKLAIQVKALQFNPDLDMVFCGVDEFCTPPGIGGLRKPMKGVPGILPSALMIRRRSFERIGPFSRSRSRVEWVEWYTRATDKGITQEVLSEVLVRRRLRGGSNSSVGEDYSRELLDVLRAKLTQPSTVKVNW